MNEYKIVIDAGHGGDDPGALGNGIIEKDLNLKISEYMYNRFRELGIPVKIIRSTDTTIAPNERTRKITEAFGNNKDVIVISNHINAGGGEGAEVIYALRNNSNLANKVLESIGEEGQIMRKAYQRRLPSDPSKDYYFIHRDTGVTQPIIVEYGFLDNINDANKLKNNSLKYAEAVVRAVLDYIGYDTDKETYTVQKGDSLWSIAKRYGLTVEEIKAANNLTSNLLNVGQTIKIPIKEEPIPGDYIVYTVKSGDNLYNIARQFNTSVDRIVEYNNLGSTNLSVGQRLLIPSSANQPSTSQYDTYTVKSGDNLYSIARNYSTTANELMSINNLSSNLLSIGQKLLVPKNDKPSSNTYIVQKGDSLYSIANKFGITFEELKSINNLTSNIINIGQVLNIPNNDTTIYIVKSGDNLYSIANKFGTTVNAIKQKNNLTSNVLSIGQSLEI